MDDTKQGSWDGDPLSATQDLKQGVEHLDKMMREASRPRASNKVLKKRAARDRKRNHLRLVNEQRADAERNQKPTMRYAGAAPVIDHQPNGFRVYAEASPPEAKHIPRVTVFLFPDGQVGAATEQASTAAMKQAFDQSVRELAPTIGGELDGKWCAALHRELVAWLRREWTIGRVMRSGGLWEYLGTV